MHRRTAKTLTVPKTNKQDKKDEKNSETVTTPIAPKNSFCEDEYSPIQIRCTQDGGDDELDVVWDDYNSPQSRIRKSYHRTRKRTNNISPQIPRKIIHSKNNLRPKFSSLKAELEKLNNRPSVDLDENVNNYEIEIENFKLSPELFAKPQINENQSNKTKVKVNDPFENDPFGDDSLDEELIKCSQQIEAAIFKPQPRKVENLIINNALDIADDSFEAMLNEFTEEDIVRLSQENEKTPVKNTPRKFYRTNSTPVNSPNIIKAAESKCSTPLRSDKLPRTKSVNDCTKLPYVSTPVKTCSPEEIEKKRQEAKAKLELKKLGDFQKEIERKRLEALERLKKNKSKKSLY